MSDVTDRRKNNSEVDRRNSKDYDYLIEKIDDLTVTVHTAIDVVGSLTTQLNATRLTAERNVDRITNLESIAGANHVRIDTLDDRIDDLDKSIDSYNNRVVDLEKWQWRTVGMFGLLVAEVPIAITILLAVLHK